MQRQQVIVSVAYCITFCGQSKQRFWLLISNEDGGKSTRQQGERQRKRDTKRAGERAGEREQPWHHRLALGHLRDRPSDRRIDEPGHLVMLAKKGTTCSPVGTRYSALSSAPWSALFWSIWNTKKKFKQFELSGQNPWKSPLLTAATEANPGGKWHAACGNCWIVHFTAVTWCTLAPLSPSPSLLATEMAQKRFLILIAKDSPWSIIIIRRASPADLSSTLCISRRRRCSSWVHANKWMSAFEYANTACKWMRIQEDNLISSLNDSIEAANLLYDTEIEWKLIEQNL